MNHLLFLDRWRFSQRAGAPHAAGAGVVAANRVLSRNQSGRLSGSTWRNSNAIFFSRSTIAARCTQGSGLEADQQIFRHIGLRSSALTIP
jgi:hypothetical protein